jgi:hypothetical protein
VRENRNIPAPIVDAKEATALDVLSERYKKLVEPGKVQRSLKMVGTKIADIIPEKIKDFGSGVVGTISEQDLYRQALELVTKGFKSVEEVAAKCSISENAIISKINKVDAATQICNIDEICFVRSYDISKLVSSYKTKDFFIALAEGGVTGVAGFAGIPFNLVLSTFLYFRAVQSIAMFYGYDVKTNIEEMVIASEVFTRALSPAQDDVNNELTATISKIMLMSQAAVVKQTAKKTWTDMASKGGVPLLIAQMRALANKAAAKALERAGAKGLENSLFREAFEQIGRKLTLKFVQRAVPVVSAVFGALIDAAQMKKVLDYADVFYQKRFIIEKESRITAVIGDSDLIISAEIISEDIEQE